jgi:hypothetical protein
MMKIYVIIMLIIQRQKLPFDNMLCLFSTRWPGGGGGGGRKPKKKRPEIFLIFQSLKIQPISHRS